MQKVQNDEELGRTNRCSRRWRHGPLRGAAAVQAERRVHRLSPRQRSSFLVSDSRSSDDPVKDGLGRILSAAEENPVLGVWDENAFIDSGLYAGGQYPVGGFVAVIHTLRRWTAEWLATLSPEQLDRKAMHPERGPQSVRTILSYTTWHLEHHARFLNAKICKLLGPAPEGGGCGEGCGCHKK